MRIAGGYAPVRSELEEYEVADLGRSRMDEKV